MGPLPWLRRGAFRVSCGLVLACAATLAGAQDAQEINRLLRLGQLDAAAVKADALLAKNPKDAQSRFIKGVVLSEQGKSAEAIALFQALTEDYPELPEPYNNLASLFAAKGQYEKAKTALEMAIQTNPSYATAYENLGDVYARMASQAYDKALQLDKSNASANAKLASIRNAFAAATKPAAAAPSAPAAPVKGEAPKPAAAASAPPAAKAQAAAGGALAAAATGESGAVLRAVNAWASAWSARNLDGYLGAYSRNFTPEGMSRAQWEAARRASFPATREVQVSIEQPQVELVEGNQAQVTFHQRYRSERTNLNTRKFLLLAREGDGWHIAQEKILP
ncbi:MAG: tetratricopeptide repeat protein [Betaproteobacteria bacterium]|nr:tetratricopeptide repeat protein [Betaproteobacteria bacterium]